MRTTSTVTGVEPAGHNTSAAQHSTQWMDNVQESISLDVADKHTARSYAPAQLQRCGLHDNTKAQQHSTAPHHTAQSLEDAREQHVMVSNEQSVRQQQHSHKGGACTTRMW
jgi:hypothetical protein